MSEKHPRADFDGCRGETVGEDYCPDCGCNVSDADCSCPEAPDFPCPFCGGEAWELGKLGALTYYRCRYCGLDFVPEQEGEPSA